MRGIQQLLVSPSKAAAGQAAHTRAGGSVLLNLIRSLSHSLTYSLTGSDLVTAPDKPQWQVAYVSRSWRCWSRQCCSGPARAGA
jgi:hypothetical protein